MRALALLLAIPVFASAQIQDLATTDDGAQTYFSTAYRQKGTQQADYLKIFRIAENGLELFRQLQLIDHPGVDPNHYRAELPSVSADGKVVAYTAASTCTGVGSHCLGFVYNNGYLAGAADRYVGNGKLTVSPDGRSYLFQDRSYAFENALSIIGNVQTPDKLMLNGYEAIGDGAQLLANGPVALLYSSGTYGLWKAGQFTPVRFQTAPVQARLSARGDMIVYVTASAGASYQLHSYSTSSGRDLVLVTGDAVPSTGSYYPPAADFHPWLTADGSHVAYVLGNQYLLQATTGGAPETLFTATDDRIVSSVIAGRGTVAFVGTASGRLVRIDTVTGGMTELIAAVPHLEITGGATAPGARLDVTISGPEAADPELIGAGADAPVVARSGNTVTLQIPWEATADSSVSLVASANRSALEEVHDLLLQRAAPKFYTLSNSDPAIKYSLAAHQDFSGIVTQDSPARTGEVIHFYLTGLGPVSPSIATGSPAPRTSLFLAQNPFGCQFRQGTESFPAEILFAGLAPGLVGVNQLDMRIPAGLGGPIVQIECTSQLPVGTSSDFVQLPVLP